MAGTVILLTAAPTKTVTRFGISSQKVTGGWVANASADPALPGNDAYYKLTDFTNDDADATTGNGATPKALKVAVHVLPGTNSQMSNIRVMLSFNGSTSPSTWLDGHIRPFDWTTNSYTTAAPVGLGSVTCDIGLLVDNHFNFEAHNCQFVGYWRMAGVCKLNIYGNDLTAPVMGNQGSEYCVFSKCTMQGMVGYLERGGDLYPVVAVDGTANTVTIPWTNDHSFNLAATLGRFRTVTSARGGILSFTGTTISPDGTLVTLTGVTHSSGSQFAVGDTLCPAVYTRALSNTVIRDGEMSGMMHASFYRTQYMVDSSGTNLGLRPSACFEIHGYGLRGIMVQNVKFVSYDDVWGQIHNAQDVFFSDNVAVESFYVASTGRPDASSVGMRLIASPKLPAPVYPFPSTYGRGAYNCAVTAQIYFNTIFNFLFVQLAPLFPTIPGYSSQTRFTAAGDKGLFEPASVQSPPLFVQSYGAAPGAAYLNAAYGADRGIADDATTPVIYYQASSSDLIFRTRDQTTPTTYDVRLRYSQAYQRWQVGSPLIFGSSPSTGPMILWGAGTPTIAANPGSLYLNTNGGAGATLWVKESGTGTTGWISK